MEIILAYIVYLWITIIHCLFVGSTCYFLFGNLFMKQSYITNTIIIGTILAFLETYWMVLPEYLGLSIYTTNKHLHSHFNIDATTNIFTILKPTSLHIFLWLVQGYWVQKIAKGRYLRIKELKK